MGRRVDEEGGGRLAGEVQGSGWRRRAARGLRLVGWLGLSALCAVTLRDAVCTEEARDCQEATRRGLASAERVCRERYFETRDPDDGRALAQALLRRGERRGAAAVAQGLLLTPARPEALSVLAQVAVAEGRLDEAQRALELAAELHLRLARRGEAGQALLELGVVLARRGEAAEGRRAIERAAALAVALGDAALADRCRAAAERVRALGAMPSGAMPELPTMP